MSENQKLLTPQQKEEIKMAFDFFDVTGEGTIQAKNLKVVLRALGFDPSNEEIIKLINLKDPMKKISKLEDYKIDFQEFLEIMIAKMVAKLLIRMKKTVIPTSKRHLTCSKTLLLKFTIL